MSNKKLNNAKHRGRPKGVKNQTKSPVYLREKTLQSGNKSLYLDIFLGQGTGGNLIHEYEFLKLYLTGNKHADKETLRQAETIRAARIIEINNGNHNALQSKQAANADFLTFAELQADKKRTNKRGEINERGTSLTYKSFICHFKQYTGNRRVTFKQIDKRFCQGFITYLQKQTSTRDHTPLKINTQIDYIKVFETILNAAIKQEIITINPMALCEKPQRQSHDIIFLSVQELKKLENTECQKPGVKAAFLFACYTGLRFSDIRGLTWEKIVEFAGETCLHIRQQKTNTLQYLPIGDKAKQFLPARRDAAGTDAIFNLSTNCYTNIFLKSWARESGVTKQISFHTARHTAATLLLALGENIKTISGILGHSNSAITEKHYAALQIAPLAQAMKKFNNI
ncbi:MAG: site-specific integrase [Dysgonamonadaceae bacterium]|jgi:integrase|nr:site-specific integrase [Dysgonamonadaceae bacterium]